MHQSMNRYLKDQYHFFSSWQRKGSHKQGPVVWAVTKPSPSRKTPTFLHSGILHSQGENPRESRLEEVTCKRYHSNLFQYYQVQTIKFQIQGNLFYHQDLEIIHREHFLRVQVDLS